MSLRGSPIRRLEFITKEPSQSYSLNAEIDRLNAAIHSKNLEIKDLYDENRLIKKGYEEQITEYVNRIRVLEDKLKAVQSDRNVEFDVIKQKYEKLAIEESENMKSYHSHEVEFLLRQIATLRVDNNSKDETIAMKQNQIVSLTQSFNREIESKIGQINNLNRSLLLIEESKNKEIKDLNSKRQLQKSRTSVALESRKQNNQFMDKQIRKLNEDILQKAIKIENLTRQLNRNKRKSEESEKALNKKIQDLINQKEEQAKQREEHFAKVQKSLRQQILQFKSNQLKLLNEIDSLKSSVENYKFDLQRNEEAFKSKEEELSNYKELLNKQRQDHTKQIAKLMKERKKKSSNLGSSRSLTSSLRDTGGVGTEDPSPLNTNTILKRMDSIRLATVKQESPDKSLNRSMQRSQITQNQEQQENDTMKLIYHYDTLIQQLKESHSSELELMKIRVNKLSKTLEQKQHELLDILTRFSPLVKIHAEEKSVEEDRRQRMERHWKADLSLLEIILNKYKIKTFQ